MADILGWLNDAQDAVNNAKDKVLEIGGYVIEGLDRFAEEVHSPLTEQEQAIVTNIFGETSIDYDKITTIDEAAFTYINGHFNNGERAFVFGNNIYFPQEMNIEGPPFLTDFDLSDPVERAEFNRLLNLQALLVHETAHVWQFQNDGFGYIFDSLSNQEYHYSVDDLRNNTSLSDFGVEQAAGIAEAFHILSNLPDEYFDGGGQWAEPGHLEFTVTTAAERDEMMALMQPFIDEYRAGSPMDGVMGEVNEGAFEILDAIVDGAQETVAEVDEAIESIRDEWQAGDYLGAGWEVLEGGFEIGWEVVEGVATTAWEGIEAAAEIGWAAIEEVGEWAWDGIQDGIDWISDGISDGIDTVGGWISDGIDNVTDWVDGAVDDVTDWVGGAVDDVTSWVDGAIDEVEDVVDDAVSWVASAAGNFVSWVSGF